MTVLFSRAHVRNRIPKLPCGRIDRTRLTAHERIVLASLYRSRKTMSELRGATGLSFAELRRVVTALSSRERCGYLGCEGPAIAYDGPFLQVSRAWVRTHNVPPPRALRVARALGIGRR